jgi:two-component system sensor histidine kinase UhpB
VSKFGYVATRFGRVRSTDAQSFARRALRGRLRRLKGPRTLFILDLSALCLVAAAFVQIGPPEALFHGVFLILTAEAFVFGRRVSLERVAASSVALVAYAFLAFAHRVAAIDLTEWPLMFTIAILVAGMADRELVAAQRYAGLYRIARDRLVNAQEEERRQLARDLHDGIGQTLTALSLTLDGIATADGSTGRRDLSRAKALTASALAEARSAAERLRPPRLAQRGLASALRELAASSGARVEASLDRVRSDELPPGTVLEVYRIAQESLSNAIRHAAAEHIRVSLARTREGVCVTVEDDGVGFDPRSADTRRIGLGGMRERAAAIGADLSIESQTGHGTRVRLVVPQRPGGHTAEAAGGQEDVSAIGTSRA